MNPIEKGFVFEHEVMCEDEWVWISFLVDFDGHCSKIFFDFPAVAKENLSISFTSTPLSEMAGGAGLDEVIPLDEYVEVDEESGLKFVFLGEDVGKLMLEKEDLIMSFTDEEGNLMSCIQSLKFFHNQLRELGLK